MRIKRIFDDSDDDRAVSMNECYQSLLRSQDRPKTAAPSVPFKQHKASNLSRLSGQHHQRTVQEVCRLQQEWKVQGNMLCLGNLILVQLTLCVIDNVSNSFALKVTTCSATTCSATVRGTHSRNSHFVKHAQRDMQFISEIVSVL